MNPGDLSRRGSATCGRQMNPWPEPHRNRATFRRKCQSLFRKKSLRIAVEDRAAAAPLDRHRPRMSWTEDGRRRPGEFPRAAPWSCGSGHLPRPRRSVTSPGCRCKRWDFPFRGGNQFHRPSVDTITFCGLFASVDTLIAGWRTKKNRQRATAMAPAWRHHSPDAGLGKTEIHSTCPGTRSLSSCGSRQIISDRTGGEGYRPHPR